MESLKALKGSSYLVCPLFLNVFANCPAGPLDATTIMGNKLASRQKWSGYPSGQIHPFMGRCINNFVPVMEKSAKVIDVKTLATSVAFTDV